MQAELDAFNSWLTQTIRSAKPTEANQYLQKEKQRTKVSTWFKALVTDKAIQTQKVAETWKPNTKFFNSGNFRELRTELALQALKAEGKIYDFHAARNVSSHDALGIDFWVELKPQGFSKKSFLCK